VIQAVEALKDDFKKARGERDLVKEAQSLSDMKVGCHVFKLQ
jgi:hypothetical protein